MTILYDLIFLAFAAAYLPYFISKKKYHSGIWQRFGLYPETINCKLSSINSFIWIHAVSVGEVAAIRPFWERIRERFPERKIMVSVITKTGYELAREFANIDETVLYLPLDFSAIVSAFLKRFNPSVLIIAETEIWPNLINLCFKKNCPMVLINGRISDKAFKRYLLIRPLLKTLLEKIGAFCVRSQEDMHRFVLLGARPKDVEVSGNLKFCNLSKRGPDEAKKTRDAFLIKEGELLFVAGSTHKGEEEILLDIYVRLSKRFSTLRLVIAPRHIERAGAIRQLAKDRSVMVIDKIGILNDLYHIADIVFVGGSLIRHGGHNIIEPAVFAKPILFGPYMFNFKDIADEFLKNDAAIMVKDAAGLEESCGRLLSDKDERAALGINAKRVVIKNQGALDRCIAKVEGIIRNA